jgi:hypothetical protein
MIGAYCLAKPHSFDTYLLSQQPLARQACRYSPHFLRRPGEPLSVLAQKPWHVLSRSEQLFASAGDASVNISAAAQESLAPPSKKIRNFTSQSDPSER